MVSHDEELSLAHQSPTMMRIREMILRSELKPGERLREVELAERLGVSRTPIRQALPALAQEGLLTPNGARGYAVRSFTRDESLAALRLRATLEGLAARAVAERADRGAVVAELDNQLRAGDRLMEGYRLTEALESGYAEINQRFHDIVIAAAGQSLLNELIDRCNAVPFTAPNVIAFETRDEQETFNLLFYAHRQHHAIAEAIRQGDAGRAEMLFREHATTQEISMDMTPSVTRRLQAE